MRYELRLILATTLAAIGGASEALALGIGASRGGYAAGPRGGAVGGARGGAYVGPRGTTVQAGRVGGVGVGPYGGVHAGGASGARVTTPAGRTYATGRAGGAAVGPYGGVRAGGVGGTVGTGPYRGGAVGGRGGVAVGPIGGVAVGGSRVAVGGVGHYTRYVGPSALRTTGTYVRSGFGYNCFTPTWYRTHTAAWVAPRWAVANYWVPPVWPVVSVYCGIAAPPILYDYGSNIVIENNYVYIDGTSVATAPQFAEQALTFANIGRGARAIPNDEFQPLGVFGLIQGDEKTAQNIFQLAVNKAGIVRGNYYDAIADNNLPVYGSVDSRSQRVAWSIGDKKDIVFETGLSNLTTEQQTTVLVHYGKERTQQMILVRLEEPRQ